MLLQPLGQLGHPLHIQGVPLLPSIRLRQAPCLAHMAHHLMVQCSVEMGCLLVSRCQRLHLQMLGDYELQPHMVLVLPHHGL